MILKHPIIQYQISFTKQKIIPQVFSLYHQLTQNCTSMRKLDLSYCVRLSQSPDNQSLWTLPVTLTNLSLCGIMLDDKEILVEALERLRNLQTIRLCGISCLDDETFTKVGTHLYCSYTQSDIFEIYLLFEISFELNAITLYLFSSP